MKENILNKSGQLRTANMLAACQYSLKSTCFIVCFQPNVFLHGLKHLFLTVSTNELEGTHSLFLTATLLHLQFARGKNTAY